MKGTPKIMTIVVLSTFISPPSDEVFSLLGRNRFGASQADDNGPIFDAFQPAVDLPMFLAWHCHPTTRALYSGYMSWEAANHH